MSEVSRRAVVAGIFAGGSLSLAGCVSPPPRQSAQLTQPALEPLKQAITSSGEFNYAALYAPAEGERFPVPAVRLSSVDPAFLRKEIDYVTAEPPGTIIVDPKAHYLYLVLGGGRAMRYGVGVGREGFGWTGTATINSKQEWPDWYPPKEMVERQPELKKTVVKLQSGLGVAGGPRNPIGVRALYLWQNNKDTLYRIHGTTEPWTIGKSVSSGCIRMINQDVIDLYQRVPVGTKVVVLPSSRSVTRTARRPAATTVPPDAGNF